MESLNKVVPYLEREYDVRKLRADFDALGVQWSERSEAFRRKSVCTLDQPYGASPRERLDIFHAGRANAPLLIFIHGGYWQRGDKSLYSFVAEPFVQAGIDVCLLTYTLCPAGSIAEIEKQVETALVWLWRKADDLGVSRSFHLAGHSAGGQLTAMMMTRNWTKIAPGLPKEILASTLPMSGLYDLEPLVRTTLNDALRLDEGLAGASSALSLEPASAAPTLVIVGGGETKQFRAQSLAFVGGWKSKLQSIEFHAEPEVDHFDLLNRMADPSSGLFRKMVEWITRAATDGRSTQDIGDPTLALMDEIVSAFNKHDADRVADYFTEDAEMVLAGGPDIWGARIVGKDAIKNALKARFDAVPDIRWQDAKTWIIGNKVLSEWRVRGTPKQGKPIDCLGCDLWEFQAGKITKKDTYYKAVTG